MPRDPLAKPLEVAEYLNKNERTLANWRSLGIGPDYVKAEGEVRYRWRDVERWVASKTVQPGRTA